jgi:hypothetical protein
VSDFKAGDLVEVDVRSVRKSSRPPKWELAIVRGVAPDVSVMIEWVEDDAGLVPSGKFFSFPISAVRHTVHGKITAAIRGRRGED